MSDHKSESDPEAHAAYSALSRVFGTLYENCGNLKEAREFVTLYDDTKALLGDMEQMRDLLLQRLAKEEK